MATFMDPKDAAEQLRSALRGHRGDLTIADAAAKSGLAFRDAERGLYALLERYPGNLKATSEGDLLFSFPAGLDKPRKELTAWYRFWKRAGSMGKAASRFLVRAWLSVVVIGYAVLFLAVVIALFVASASQNREGGRGRGIGGGFEIGYLLFRVIAEALFWTFHPGLSYGGYGRGAAQTRGRWGDKTKEAGVPFYEKVNRFVFGPEPPPEDPRERERRMLAEIRRQKGRVGVSDVMRVLGVSKKEADPFLARLMLDYDGEVEVADNAGITYHFPDVRRTAAAAGEASTSLPAMLAKVEVAPLTGNPAGSNLLVAALNGFNLVMALVALSLGITIADLFLLFEGLPLQADGTAWALGIIPAAFSAWIFTLPLWRALKKPAERRQAAHENGRRALLRRVLDKVGFAQEAGFDEAELKEAWQKAAGEAPDEAALTRAVLEMGGDLEVAESGRTQYRFVDLEAEVAALQAERGRAQSSEAQVGEVVYAAEELPSRR
jgi:hypothetical protein